MPATKGPKARKNENEREEKVVERFQLDGPHQAKRIREEEDV